MVFHTINDGGIFLPLRYFQRRVPGVEGEYCRFTGKKKKKKKRLG